MEPKKWEERALTRFKTEELIHTIVQYVAKNRRSHWNQLMDAGETTIVLETGKTNLLPAIARQARCQRIMSPLDIPSHEPQFHFKMESPIEILQAPYKYGRNGGPMDEDVSRCSRCNCFRKKNRPRCCLLKLDIESPNKFRSIKQLPRTDLIQMLQTLDEELIAKGKKKKKGKPLKISNYPHLSRLFFNFAHERIFTIETLGSLSVLNLNLLKDKIPGFKRPFKIIMKRIKEIMDVRFEEAAAIEEERLRLEIIREAEEEAKAAEEALKKQEEDLALAAEEKTGEEQGEEGIEGKVGEGGEKGDEVKQEEEGEKKEDKENVEEKVEVEEDKEDTKEDTKDAKEQKTEEQKTEEQKTEEQKAEEQKAEEQQQTDDTDIAELTEEEKKEKIEEELLLAKEEETRLQKEKEKKEQEERDALLDEDGNPLPEPLIVSDPILIAALYSKLDLRTTRTVEKIYMSREMVDEDTLLMNPFAKGSLVSIFSTRGKELLLQYLLHQFFHLSYEEVIIKLNEIFDNNIDAIEIETEHHTHFLTTQLHHIVLGSYCLHGTWNLVLDIRQHGPLGTSSHNKSNTNDTKGIAEAKGKKEFGRVGNYSPRETRELFIDLMLECSLMREKMDRVFELRDIRESRMKFLEWRGDRKRPESETSPIRKRKKKKKVTVMQRRKKVQKEFPYNKEKYRYLYQMIAGLKQVSVMHSEHIRVTVEGQLLIVPRNNTVGLGTINEEPQSHVAHNEETTTLIEHYDIR